MKLFTYQDGTLTEGIEVDEPNTTKACIALGDRHTGYLKMVRLCRHEPPEIRDGKIFFSFPVTVKGREPFRVLQEPKGSRYHQVMIRLNFKVESGNPIETWAKEMGWIRELEKGHGHNGQDEYFDILVELNGGAIIRIDSPDGTPLKVISYPKDREVSIMTWEEYQKESSDA